MPDAADHIWQSVLAILREEVTDLTFHLWLAPLEPLEVTDSVLFVHAPDHARTWVEQRYGTLLVEVVRRAMGPGAAIELVGDDFTGPAASTANRPELQPQDELNPKYTFDQFVIGAGNRLAHAAALAVAESPSQAYNPLFIHGQPGLGKTHLLHAIGNYLRTHSAGLTVRYAPVELFTAAFVRAARGGDVATFKERFRDVNVLLIDDVQFMANKTQTKEEFFHTFNALYEGGSQLVLTNDRAPGDMDAFEERLVERFGGGLVAELDAPDFEVRLAILRKRAHLDGLDLDDATLAEVARRVPASVRSLEGALIRLVAHASLHGDSPSPAVARAALGPSAHEEAGPPTVERIQSLTAEVFGLDRAALLRKDRRASVARARQVAMYLARELTTDSLPELGRRFAGRNHSTVLHAHRKVLASLEDDPELRTTVEALWRRLGGVHDSDRRE